MLKFLNIYTGIVVVSIFFSDLLNGLIKNVDYFRFLVDDVPIRRYPRKSAATFPLRPMWVYGSIWDASSWATEDGKYKADYRYQPFVARYTRFQAGGCSAYAPNSCHPVSASPFRSGGLTRQQYRAMRWVQTHHMVYNYCRDPRRDHSLTPECWRWSWNFKEFIITETHSKSFQFACNFNIFLSIYEAVFEMDSTCNKFYARLWEHPRLPRKDENWKEKVEIVFLFPKFFIHIVLLLYIGKKMRER